MGSENGGLYEIMNHDYDHHAYLYVMANITTESSGPALLEDRLESRMRGGTGHFRFISTFPFSILSLSFNFLTGQSLP